MIGNSVETLRERFGELCGNALGTLWNASGTVWEGFGNPVGIKDYIFRILLL
jgi:hypothetical protein